MMVIDDKESQRVSSNDILQNKNLKPRVENSIPVSPDTPEVFKFDASLQTYTNLTYTYEGQDCQEIHFWSELITATNSSGSLTADIAANVKNLYKSQYH